MTLLVTIWISCNSNTNISCWIIRPQVVLRCAYNAVIKYASM